MNERNDIDDFFNQYAARVNWALWEGQFDADGIMHSFAEDFIGASPLVYALEKMMRHSKKQFQKGGLITGI